MCLIKSMGSSKFAMLVVVIFSLLTVLADIYIKRASDKNQLLSFYFFMGMVIYSLSAFGWFFALRHLKLATLGSLFALLTLVFTLISGVFIFREKLLLFEWVLVFVSTLMLVVFWNRI